MIFQIKMAYPTPRAQQGLYKAAGRSMETTLKPLSEDTMKYTAVPIIQTRSVAQAQYVSDHQIAKEDTTT